MNPNEITLETAMQFMHDWHNLADTSRTGNDRGKCYDNCARFVLEKGEFEGAPLLLCHGQVWSEKLGYHGHAWVEWGDGHPMVFDPSNGEEVATVVLAGDYYQAAQIRPFDVKRYTRDELRTMMVANETYGPWE